MMKTVGPYGPTVPSHQNGFGPSVSCFSAVMGQQVRGRGGLGAEGSARRARPGTYPPALDPKQESKDRVLHNSNRGLALRH